MIDWFMAVVLLVGGVATLATEGLPNGGMALAGSIAFFRLACQGGAFPERVRIWWNGSSPETWQCCVVCHGYGPDVWVSGKTDKSPRCKVHRGWW